MSSKKNKKKRQYHSHNAIEVIIRKNTKNFLQAEKIYWKERTKIDESIRDAINKLSLQAGKVSTNYLSSTVIGLIDGVVFIREKTTKKIPVIFIIAPIPHSEWLFDHFLPRVGNEILNSLKDEILTDSNTSLKSNFVKQLSSPIILLDSDNQIQSEISFMNYEEDSYDPIERAILDFQLTLLGLQTQSNHESPSLISHKNTINSLNQIASEFEDLLNIRTKEEELHRFLNQYSFILHPSAEVISKKKLGEDFITDFVLIASTTQGPIYILVELENSNHKLLTKGLTLTAPVNHALKQTRDWDVWLESNKSYIQNKLPNFETPKYLIVIGRTDTFTEIQKEYMRSYNRQWQNLEILSYDDVLENFKNTIIKLSETINKNE